MKPVSRANPNKNFEFTKNFSRSDSSQKPKILDLSSHIEGQSDDDPEPEIDSVLHVEKHSSLRIDIAQHLGTPKCRLAYGEEIKACILPNKDRVRASDTVELKTRSGQPQEYLLVHYVTKQRTNKGPRTFLIGLRLCQNSDSDGQLPYEKSAATEVHLNLQYCHDSARMPIEQSLVKVNAVRATRIRSYLLTNELYPAISHVNSNDQPVDRDILVCRWMQCHAYRNKEARLARRNPEYSFRRLSQNDCGSACSIPDVSIWKAFAQESQSGHTTSPRVKLVAERPKMTLGSGNLGSNVKVYTSGEAFCGAGGASWALREAGFCCEWAFDKWETACKSHDLNFKDAKCYNIDHEQFIMHTGQAGQVDHLHLSPPCQWCSRANTQGELNDSDHRACFLATGRLVDAAKCRSLSFEQVDGILYTKHAPYFRSLIHDLTSRNYSIRWKVISMDDYGLVHARKRLILFASA